MKSLKHYFSSPAASTKEVKEVSKEPLQSSQNIDENKQSSGKDEVKVNGVKDPKKRKKEVAADPPVKSSKPKKSTSEKSKELQKVVDVCDEEKVCDEPLTIKQKPEKAEDSPKGTPKSNAFQMLMSQKKPVTPESETEKKRKSLPTKESKKSKPEAKDNNKVKEDSGKKKGRPPKQEKKSSKNEEEKPDVQEKAESSDVEVVKNNEADEKAQEEKPLPRRSRQAKDKANKSFADQKDSDADDKPPREKGRRSSRKITEEVPKEKPILEDSDDELFLSTKIQKRKRVVSSDEEQPKSPKNSLSKIAKTNFETKEKSEESDMEVDVVKVIPSPKKQKASPAKAKKQEVEEPDSDDDFKPLKGNKRKQKKNSEKLLSSPQKSTPVVKKGIASFFNPISKEEAQKRAATVLESAKVQTVKADIHPEPQEQKKRSMGPSGRLSSSRSPREDEAIEILESEVLEGDVLNSCEVEKVLSTPKRTSPQKMPKKKRLWELRVKLLSPAKSEVSSINDESETSDSDSELEILSPAKHQINKSLGWGAGGKLAPIFLPKTKSSPVPSPLASATRKIFSSAPLPQIRAVPTEHTIGYADEKPDTPINAIHPSVGHVGQYASKSILDEKSQRLLELLQNKDTNESIEPKSFDLGHIPELPAKSKKKATKKKSKGSESWCEKYKPKLASAVAGNESSVYRLRNWLEGWTESKTGANKGNSESDYSEDSMDAFVVSDDDDSNHAKRKKKRKKTNNTVLLVGPSGCGKTATVYAIAEELGFKVLEVNASSKRSGKRILSELREATQSHQVRSLDQDSINNFFGKGKSSQSSEIQSQANSQSLSLILIEDVDIIFEEQDEGFTAALNSLAENSKRPLVLVSNDPNCSLVLSRQHRIHFQFERVPVSTSVDIIEDICQTEGEEVDGALLKQLVVQNKGDLRSTFLAAHFFAVSGGFPKKFSTKLNFPVSLEDIFLRLQTKQLPDIVKLGDAEEEPEESPNLNKTWGGDSDDDQLFQNLPFKSKIVNKIRSKLATKVTPELLAKEPISVPLKELEVLSEQADRIAALDLLLGHSGHQIRNNMLPGLSDQETMEPPINLNRPLIAFTVAEKVLNYYKLENTGIEYWEHNSNWHQTHCSVDRSLKDLLPISDQLDHKGVSLDYLPILRELGKCEQSSTRSSRRSAINCLQSIGMQTDQFVIDALPFIFS